MRWARRATTDVLVVCTGNVCRSPYVAARLRGQLPGLQVASAGTGALVGREPAAQVVDLLTSYGDARDLPVARSLTRGQVRGARLVLTADRSHRVQAARWGAADRAFTVLEAARVVRDAGAPRGLGPDGVADLVRRVVAQEDVDHDDDLADPWGASAEAYRRMADDLEEALAVLVPALKTPD